MRVLVNLIAFVGGLWAGTAATSRSIAGMTGQTAGAMEHLVEHGGDYDIIVVGSSFTKVNFLPTVFDEHMTELGHPVLSFGLGMKGMRGAEIHYYLERILELHLPKLKWLLVDVSLDQNMLLDPAGGFQRRAIEWHGWPQFLLSVRHLSSRGVTLEEQLPIVNAHLRHLLLKRGNIGFGLEALCSGVWLDGPPRVKPRGSLVTGASVAHGQRWKVERYLKGRARHGDARDQLKEKRKRPPQPALSGFMERAMRDLARAHGKRIAFILSPVLSDARFETEVRGDTPLEVLDFDDPEKYPELYDPGMRYDPNHLSYEGSVLFSRALAETVSVQLYRKPAPAPASAAN